ncbi:Thymidylate kinase [Vibrio phage vB_VpaM_sm033]|nr:Thymidylate kinase [Vibrio phage vB_VpaM_sm033]
MSKGKLISFDGLGGSGKSTQIELLKKALEEKGYNVVVQKFPNYDSPTGKIIKEYLDGKFGENIPPDFVQSLYALDRVAMKDTIATFLNRGVWVILDRSAYSGLAYQSARYSLENLYYLSFIDEWATIEFEACGIRVPDLRIYLRTDPDVAMKAIEERAKLEKDQGKDVHENDVELNKAIVKSFEHISLQFSLKRINVLDSKGRMYEREYVHERIMEKVEPHFLG